MKDQTARAAAGHIRTGGPSSRRRTGAAAERLSTKDDPGIAIGARDRITPLLFKERSRSSPATAAKASLLEAELPGRWSLGAIADEFALGFAITNR